MLLVCTECRKELGPFDIVETKSCKKCGTIVERSERMGGSHKYRPEPEIEELLRAAGIEAERCEKPGSGNLDGIRWKLKANNAWHCDLSYDPQFGRSFVLQFITPVASELSPEAASGLQLKHGLEVVGERRTEGTGERVIASVWMGARQLLPLNSERATLLRGCIARLDAILHEIKTMTEKE